MSARLPVDPHLLEMAATLANLDLTPVRAKELVPVMTGVFAMLDALDPSTLGETAPAAAFQALWEN
ncbi:MAG: hypothetical protein ACLGHY_05090 [Gammaproteobacteria bacterium]